MKLIYRGQAYEYEPGVGEAPAVEQVREPRSSYRLQYRGLAYTVNPNVVERQPVVSPVANLIYRGATYAMNGWQPTARPVGMATGAGVSRSSQTAPGLAAVHRRNLHQNLDRRIQIACERGDRELVQALERELRQI
ncbi:MAG: DUF4278 domain-containing protein [Leptolyngbyaceae cyanobacterium]